MKSNRWDILKFDMDDLLQSKHLKESADVSYDQLVENSADKSYILSLWPPLNPLSGAISSLRSRAKSRSMMNALWRKRLQREQGAPNYEVNIPARSSSYPGTLKFILRFYLYLYNALGLSFGGAKTSSSWVSCYWHCNKTWNS